MTPKLSKNQKIELKQTYKIKVFLPHGYAPKQFLNQTPTPKLDHWGLKSKKKRSQIKSKTKVRIKGPIEKKVVQLHE